MSTALDHEIEEAARRASTASDVPRQGPRPREDEPAAPSAPTRAAEWKRDEVELHVLPSGNAARLMRPRMTELMKHGKIPNQLIGAAVKGLQGGSIASEDVGEIVELLDFLTAAAFVEPQVSLEDDPSEHELPISALSDADRNYVLIWVQQGVAGLARFRLDGAGPAGGGDGGDVRDEAE